MFSKQLVAGLFLISSLGSLVNGLPRPEGQTESSLLEGDITAEEDLSASGALFRRHNVTPFKSESVVEVTVFVKSWSSLSESFKKCHSDIIQTREVIVVIKLIADLTEKVKRTKSDYEACSACTSPLKLHKAAIDTKVEIDVTMTEVYKSFSDIVSHCHDNYDPKLFVDVFATLNLFGTVSLSLCTVLDLDLQDLLLKAQIDLDLLRDFGLDFDLGVRLALGGGHGLIGN